MAKKKELTKIPVSELEVDGVYKSYVQDIMKVLEINEDTKKVLLYNISGAHKQWSEFKYINLVERLR